MYEWLERLARRVWPGIDKLVLQHRPIGVGDVLIFLFSIPMATFGLLWLTACTDITQIVADWPLYLFYQVLIAAFDRMQYYFIVEIPKDRYGSAEGSLSGALLWSAVFLIGPSALWLGVVAALLNFTRGWFLSASEESRWSNLRSFTMELTSNTLAFLIALEFYNFLGGRLPIAPLSLPMLLQAVSAQLVQVLIVLITWSFYVGYVIWIKRKFDRKASITPVIQFWLLALTLPALAYPFAILLAGIYQQNGVETFLFLISGLVLIAYLARWLSWAVEISRQRSRQLENLERLGREILNSPPDASRLSELLKEHAPTMFPFGRIVIWLYPNRYVLVQPSDWNLDIHPIWSWVQEHGQTQAYLTRQGLPWREESELHNPVVLTGIQDADDGILIGLIYIELLSQSQPWDSRALIGLFPALQSVAAQVASALHQAEVYSEILNYQATLQELEFAGRIQASFLPREMPVLDGWELAVTLVPARLTSGDYFDIMQFSDEKIGILIADVTDKGLGAALYMALSRTLIRTYALEYGMAPEIVFFSVNERILQDASANLFVTAFYGILDRATGQLTYANAGHNPPFLLSGRNGNVVHALASTGMPIGVDEDAVWTQNAIQIEPGEALVLYTDGIPDANNGNGERFGERRLIEIAQANRTLAAQELQKVILDAIQGFVGEAAQFDDITMLVIRRDQS
jgi:serine phosphatase RsbU (regulator of sigma subunit)